MKEKCQMPNCNNEVGIIDKKRIYLFDENIGDEKAVYVCDECYKKSKEEENDIDWEHSV